MGFKPPRFRHRASSPPGLICSRWSRHQFFLPLFGHFVTTYPWTPFFWWLCCQMSDSSSWKTRLHWQHGPLEGPGSVSTSSSERPSPAARGIAAGWQAGQVFGSLAPERPTSTERSPEDAAWPDLEHLQLPPGLLAGGEPAPSQHPSLGLVAPQGCGRAEVDPAPPSSGTGTGCSGRPWLM